MFAFFSCVRARAGMLNSEPPQATAEAAYSVCRCYRYSTTDGTLGSIASSPVLEQARPACRSTFFNPLTEKASKNERTEKCVPPWYPNDLNWILRLDLSIARRVLPLCPAGGAPENDPWGKRLPGSCCHWKKIDLAVDACGRCGNCILGKMAKYVVGKRKTVVYCVWNFVYCV